jgi:hypothetical protein
MKCLIPSLLLLLTFAASTFAQDPLDSAFPFRLSQRSPETLESLDPRYDTPKQAVRRKAAWKAAQRRQRLENMKRIGYSPSRPPTSTLPFMSSPTRWVIVPAYYSHSIIYRHRAVLGVPGVIR